VRYGYPRLYEWLRRLYWDEGEESNGGAFRKTTYFEHVSMICLCCGMDFDVRSRSRRDM
jgi:hypothetical protein